MTRSIILLITFFFWSFINAQNGTDIEYNFISSKGQKGAIKIHHSQFGSISEQIVISKEGNIADKYLRQKSKPDSTFSINDQDKTYFVFKKTDDANENLNFVTSRMPNDSLKGYNCTHIIMTDGIESYEMW